MAGSSHLGWGGGAEQAWMWGLQPRISEAPWVQRWVLPPVPRGGGAAPQEGSRKLQLLRPCPGLSICTFAPKLVPGN